MHGASKAGAQLHGPWWAVLGTLQLIASGVGVVAWVLITTRFQTGGLTRDWIAGGWGIAVVLYLGSTAVAGASLIAHRAAAWVSWVELTSVPLLILLAIVAIQGAVGGGAVLFFLPTAGVACGLALTTAGAAFRIRRRLRGE